MSDKKKITAIWIKLALSDLKASNILHEQKQYRTSYFLFQQAAEKANKAYALTFGIVEEEGLKSIGHNQFKIFRKVILDQINKLKDQTKGFNEDPLISGTVNDITKLALPKSRKNSKISPLSAEAKVQSLNEALSNIDKIRNHDFVNMTLSDVNGLYKIYSNSQLLNNDLFLHLKIELKKRLKQRDYYLGISLFSYMRDFYFILIAFVVCSMVTIQHSTLTRYPEKGRNPLQIYTLKLPLIKKQLLFMNLLEEALNKLNEFNNEHKFVKSLK